MKLSEKQGVFIATMSDLLHWFHLDMKPKGYWLTAGEAYRSPAEAKRLADLGVGIKSSAHCLRLAQDWNLFKDGEYLTSSDAHAPIGERWVGLHDWARWGGNFRARSGGVGRDGNHYSFIHNGVQ